MIIARKKEKENIVEYLIYMWQVEDLIRACRFDMDVIEAQILTKYDQPEHVLEEIRQWFRDIIDMMRKEGIQEKGHLLQNEQIVAELNEVHERLVQSADESAYRTLYYKVLPAIVQLRARSGDNPTSEVETCLTSIYGYVLLKLQGKDVSVETTESVKEMGRLLGALAGVFNKIDHFSTYQLAKSEKMRTFAG